MILPAMYVQAITLTNDGTLSCLKKCSSKSWHSSIMLWDTLKNDLCDTLQQHYHHPKPWHAIDKFKCEQCQQHKMFGKAMATILMGDENSMLGRSCNWLTVPWTVKVNNSKVECNAFTCIDTVSNLVELIRIDLKTLCRMWGNSRYVGFSVTHTQFIVFMTWIGSSLDTWFNSSSIVWHQGCSIDQQQTANKFDFQMYAPNCRHCPSNTDIQQSTAKIVTR